MKQDVNEEEEAETKQDNEEVKMAYENLETKTENATNSPNELIQTDDYTRPMTKKMRLRKK